MSDAIGVDPAAAIAAAVAAEMAREEEQMTPYTAADLAEGWEFKIVRASFPRFRDPAALRALLDEEAQGGWVLVEKFDDSRVRLKRPATTRKVEADFAGGYDPYRTNVDDPTRRLMLLGLGLGSLLFVALVFLVTLGLTR